ncbi:hypothetical protein [Gillisia limnaea]|jgi:hypothetical protein|uniref:Uncharacterized protein n=1 Tax=Gillisia limnaea (strain DSM 15749 / LMG 21470 / R-8282) TaxID=865937 RepID=H2BZ40_GILLR|nr:hypothetical protein [Gillisia limnaea]EHQ03385.1 hypothetical protein Gilli_2772 [Gillisia limnaea DSM 15749]
MEAIGVFVENYKETTKGFNIFAKVIVALVLAAILVGVVSAIINVILQA